MNPGQARLGLQDLAVLYAQEAPPRWDAAPAATPALQASAGWPEAGMAGALGRMLGGPSRYDGVVLERPKLGDGPAPNAGDLDRALRLYLIACGLLWALLILGGLAWRR